MRYALDTNSVIYFLKGSFPELAARMKSYPSRMIVIPEMVRAELLFGVAKSQQRAENARKLQDFLAPLEKVAFDGQAAEAYAAIRWELEQAGNLIGPNDLVIAATCVAQNATLVTRNTREFERVRGLRCEDWAGGFD